MSHVGGKKKSYRFRLCTTYLEHKNTVSICLKCLNVYGEKLANVTFCSIANNCRNTDVVGNGTKHLCYSAQDGDLSFEKN